MKHDELERFIIENKDGFDDLEPINDLFSGISTIKPKQKIIRLKYIISVAAVIIILFSIGFLYNIESPNRINSKAILSAADSSFMEFQEMEIYYVNQIELIRNDIVELCNADSELKADLNSELGMIDEMSNDLKRDLSDNVNDSEVLNAIILNYRENLKMLENLKNQIQPVLTKNMEVSDEVFNS